MGKRRLWAGIIVGAAVGGAITLLNDETRQYVKQSTAKLGDQTNLYLNDPSLGVRKMKQGVVSLNQAVTTNTESALNALDQIDNSLQKFLK